jgi:hypothetical protein
MKDLNNTTRRAKHINNHGRSVDAKACRHSGTLTNARPPETDPKYRNSHPPSQFPWKSTIKVQMFLGISQDVEKREWLKEN